MIILGLDTSASLSIAIYNDTECIAERHVETPHVASEKCAIYLGELLDENNIKTKDIDYVVVNVGPGSFTGLRVGLSVIKGLMFMTQIKLVTVTALESLLHNESIGLALLESKRDEVYMSKDGRNIEAVLKEKLSSRVTESKILVHRVKDFADYLPGVTFVEKELSAKALCKIALDKIEKNDLANYDDLDALYIKSFAGAN